MYKSKYGGGDTYEKDLKQFIKDIKEPEKKKIPKKTLKQLFVLKNSKKK
tara:strand:+ start:248 stop:394 length:147 start_codon:yes stop_codon:yes gene_type:complete